MEKEKRYIIALDEGTTSARAIGFDCSTGKEVIKESEEIKLIYPGPGLVEQDAEELFLKQYSCLKKVYRELNKSGKVIAIAIANQRETVVLWDRRSGKPIWSAIVWQCRRTAKECERLRAEAGEEIRSKTGLIPDPYFSGTKIKWMFKNLPKAEQLQRQGQLCVGTIDSYLIFKLTKGRSFVTDPTNASRTMLYNINTGDYDEDMLKLFCVDKNSLPRIIGSDETAGYLTLDGEKLPICGVAGDQQAALVGQTCFFEGESKITYGTGLFMLYNTGEKVVNSTCNMISTVAYTISNKRYFALEGSVFNAGSTVQWLRDEMGFFGESKDSEDFANRVNDSCGVYVVPAFTGLGAPYWDSECRGIITGLTRGANKYHITRAALESMAYSSKDLADMMEKDSGIRLRSIRCDGGASANDFLMQFQSDILGIKIDRPVQKESTALGAALLCGMGLGIWDKKEAIKMRKSERIFYPEMAKERAFELYEGWKKAVKRCLYNPEEENL